MTNEYKVKRDGHVHTDFCRHGSGKPTEQYVANAITNDYKLMSFTEHAPLPENYVDDVTLYNELNLFEEEVEPYLRQIHDLKKKHESRIVIYSGFEFDFLPDKTDVTYNQIREYSSEIQDAVLSLHVLPVKGKVKVLDYTPETFRTELIEPLGGLMNVYRLFLKTLGELIALAGTLSVKPRIGHPMLIRKWSRDCQLSAEEIRDVENEFMHRILPLVSANGLSIDVNVAGFDVENCRQAYISEKEIAVCRKLDIPLVYGSDAHDPDKIGRHYDYFEQHCSDTNKISTA